LRPPPERTIWYARVAKHYEGGDLI
jgi:hypothetical protein